MRRKDQLPRLRLRLPGMPRRPRKARTPYHTIAFALIQCSLPPMWEAFPELMLHHEPQRIDILVILRREQVRNETSFHQLPSLTSRLGKKATILEFKSPSDHLSGDDASAVLGYGMQLCIQRGLQPNELALGVLASKISRGFLLRLGLHGGTLTQTEQGIWEGSAGGFPFFMLELSRIWDRSEAERLWYILTPQFKKSAAPLRELSVLQCILYNKVVEYFKHQHPNGDHIMKKKVKLHGTLTEELKNEFLKLLKPEERLKGLKAEERLEGLPPEVVLMQYGAEKLLLSLRPEERLFGLRPEERLLGLRPEERLLGLRPEERLEGLTTEELAALSMQIQARMGTTPERSVS